MRCFRKRWAICRLSLLLIFYKVKSSPKYGRVRTGAVEACSQELCVSIMNYKTKAVEMVCFPTLFLVRVQPPQCSRTDSCIDTQGSPCQTRSPCRNVNENVCSCSSNPCRAQRKCPVHHPGALPSFSSLSSEITEACVEMAESQDGSRMDLEPPHG